MSSHGHVIKGTEVRGILTLGAVFTASCELPSLGTGNLAALCKGSTRTAVGESQYLALRRLTYYLYSSDS